MYVNVGMRCTFDASGKVHSVTGGSVRRETVYIVEGLNSDDNKWAACV